MAKPYISLVFILITLAACDYLGGQTESCYPRGNDIQIFSNELKKEGIKFEKSNRKDCIIVYGLDAKKDKEIREKLFGVPPPQGLNVGWPIVAYGEVDGKKFKIDESSRIMERLKEEHINTKIMIYFGDKYLVWEKKDDKIVREILYARK